MKFREVVEDVIIDSRKLTEYALNLDNPQGRDKALMFQRHLSYTKDNYQQLLSQLYEKALNADAFLQNEDRYGKRYQVDLEIQGIEAEQL